MVKSDVPVLKFFSRVGSAEHRTANVSYRMNIISVRAKKERKK